MLTEEKWSMWSVSHVNPQRWPQSYIAQCGPAPWAPYCCHEIHCVPLKSKVETPECGTSRDTGKFRRLCPGLCALTSLHVYTCSLYTLWFLLTSSFIFPALDAFSFPFGTRFVPSELPHYLGSNYFGFHPIFLVEISQSWIVRAPCTSQ